MFAVEEPEPGYSPSLVGAMGIFAVTGAGIIKTIYIGRNVRLDLTPLDFGIKTLCYYTAEAARLYQNQPQPSQAPVFITSSCTHTDFTFVEYIKIVQDFGFWDEAAFEKNFLIPGLYCTDNRFVYLTLVNN